MAQTKTEYTISEGGGVMRRTIYEDQLVITDAFVEQFAASVKARVVNAFNLPSGEVVHFVFENKAVFCTVCLNTLALHSPFRLITEEENKVMIPVFSSVNDPIMTLDWTPPLDCHLRLLAQVKTDPQPQVTMLYLFAVNDLQQYWRLPLANLHSDCRVCYGRNLMQGRTIGEALQSALAILRNAQYNADLWCNCELTGLMFRYQPLNAGFVQLPPRLLAGESWTKYCNKVGTAMQAYVV